MPAAFETELYGRLHQQLARVKIVDCHEHLPPDADLPPPEAIGIGRLFAHYASCDLIAAGMPPADLERARKETNGLSPRERWKLLKPWYERTWNTAYCESLRIALRDLYGVEDFGDRTVGPLTDAMRKQVKPGFTRTVFDRAGIDFAMNNTWMRPVYSPAQDPACFLPDMLDGFTPLEIHSLAKGADREVRCLDDYLDLIDWYFETYGRVAGAFKVGRAYNRTLAWEDVPRSAVEKTFNRLLVPNDRPDQRRIRALEDFLMHVLCRKCGEYGLRMKFHTGLQEGNGNLITNSRAALLANLFLKYPRTGFDIYHISYPYQEELATLAKNFANVTVDFCWMWIINPAAGRRALSDMLDTVPANKLHGFGGDYLFVEGAYGHAVIARREIARVLAEKVEEGRFDEAYAARVGRMLLRENAMASFDLQRRRERFRRLTGRKRRP